MNDPVNSPSHYTSIPARCTCGRTLEPIDFTRHMQFSLGNAVKYILRAPFKGKPVEDLRKAIWYLNDELKRLEPSEPKPSQSAVGYNPHHLTEEQVGTAEGWRLLRLDEEIGVDDKLWMPGSSTWTNTVRPGTYVLEDGYHFSYRTKRP